MTPERMKQWREQRAKGRARFVLVQGVLSYGLPMFVVTSAVPVVLLGRPMPTPVALTIGGVLWAVGGVVFGLTLFWVHERNYRIAEKRGDD